MALTIEDRLREIARQLDLTHGTYYGSDQCERVALFLEQDLLESQPTSLEELTKSPDFGPEMVPTSLVFFASLILVGLKLWGKHPFVHWPWIAVLSPYLLAVIGSVFHNLRLEEKAAAYIRKAVSCRDDTLTQGELCSRLTGWSLD